MNDKNNANNEELDCQVTVYDGAYNTCDMIEEASNGEEKAQNDDHI
jgi:hypothetical protein